MPARHPGAEADGSGAGGCDVVSVGADVLGGILKRWANWFCCDQDANDTALKESKIVLGEPLSDIIGQVKNFENKILSSELLSNNVIIHEILALSDTESGENSKKLLSREKGRGEKGWQQSGMRADILLNDNLYRVLGHALCCDLPAKG